MLGLLLLRQLDRREAMLEGVVESCHQRHAWSVLLSLFRHCGGVVCACRVTSVYTPLTRRQVVRPQLSKREEQEQVADRRYSEISDRPCSPSFCCGSMSDLGSLFARYSKNRTVFIVDQTTVNAGKL